MLGMHIKCYVYIVFACAVAEHETAEHFISSL